MGKRLSHKERKVRRIRLVQGEVLRQVAEAGRNPLNVSLVQFLANSQIGAIGIQEAVNALKTLPIEEMRDGR
jgi:hypothetical protein